MVTNLLLFQLRAASGGTGCGEEEEFVYFPFIEV